MLCQVLAATALACALLTVVVGIVAAVAIKGVVVAYNGAIGEVKYLLRVDGNAHKASLKMEVRTCATTCVSAECDWSASLYILILLNKELKNDNIRAHFYLTLHTIGHVYIPICI